MHGQQLDLRPFSVPRSSLDEVPGSADCTLRAVDGKQ